VWGGGKGALFLKEEGDLPNIKEGASVRGVDKMLWQKKTNSCLIPGTARRGRRREPCAACGGDPLVESRGTKKQKNTKSKAERGKRIPSLKTKTEIGDRVKKGQGIGFRVFSGGDSVRGGKSVAGRGGGGWQTGGAEKSVIVRKGGRGKEILTAIVRDEGGGKKHSVLPLRGDLRHQGGGGKKKDGFHKARKIARTRGGKRR